MTVTFFGHNDTPESVRSKLFSVIKELIDNKSADTFYIGNHGNFDRIALDCLVNLKKLYPQICFTVVLAYLPKRIFSYNTILPEGIEKVPPRFAISARNEWMISHSDYVITYVFRGGGAHRAQQIAVKKGKIVINIAD